MAISSKSKIKKQIAFSEGAAPRGDWLIFYWRLSVQIAESLEGLKKLIILVPKRHMRI